MILFKKRKEVIVSFNKISNTKEIVNRKVIFYIPFLTKIVRLSKLNVSCLLSTQVLTKDNMLVDIDIKVKIKIKDFLYIADIVVKNKWGSLKNKCMQVVLKFINEYTSNFNANKLFIINKIDLKEDKLVKEIEEIGLELISIRLNIKPNDKVSIKF